MNIKNNSVWRRDSNGDYVTIYLTDTYNGIYNVYYFLPSIIPHITPIEKSLVSYFLKNFTELSDDEVEIMDIIQ